MYIQVLFKPVQTFGNLEHCVCLYFSEIEDVVNATLFLLSNNASMLNGIITPIDGGITVNL